MSLSPETFERELHARLGRDYRLRWSTYRQSWMIEQKVGRGIWDVPLDSADPNPDRLLRAREGYALACEIQAASVVPCQDCGGPIQVPHLTIGETWCRRCELRGFRPPRRFLGYYPLCERLLARLERTSPKRDGQWQRELASRNRLLAESAVRDQENYKDSVLLDYFNRVADIPQSGYGGTIKRQLLLE